MAEKQEDKQERTDEALAEERQQDSVADTLNEPDAQQMPDYDPNLTDAQRMDDQERVKAGLMPPDRDNPDDPNQDPPAEGTDESAEASASRES